jgi:hypothetical protein
VQSICYCMLSKNYWETARQRLRKSETDQWSMTGAESQRK